MKRFITSIEIAAIVLLALVPVFASFPYRINIFLSWEGAYRISEGQLPYRDFGMPVGYMYWAIPALFFKIFGAQLITLIKAQAFINILAGLAFRSIFKTLKVDPSIRLAGVLVFCLSYSFPNFWHWYNHTVIVYQLISLAFLLPALASSPARNRNILLILSAVFLFFSFFTKQDGGGLALLICYALLGYDAWVEKRWKPVAVFTAALVITGLAMILPFSGDRFGYWFNYGQAPHTSRISIGNIINEFLAGSAWIKFYLFVIGMLLIFSFRNFRAAISEKRFVLLNLVVLGILAEASIFQVTSYVPENNNIFFHSFAIILVLVLIHRLLPPAAEWKKLLVLGAGVLLWWSPVFWKYVQRFVLPENAAAYQYEEHAGYKYATTVDRNTFMIELDTSDIPMDQWRTPALKSFEKILLPGPTVDGIERFMDREDIKSGRGELKVLNMTELTPLAAELPYKLETGSHYPLWFHKGVGMFEKETEMFIERIKNNYYDYVLYEYIPYLNNFYPYKIREALQEYYNQVDLFPAPRKPTNHAWIEIYRKPE